jgi:regulator of RNase E activity RraA
MSIEQHITRLKQLPTATISDALDYLGIDGGCEGIRPIAAGLSLVGPAFTVEFAPVAAGEPAPAADYIDEVSAGEVVVIANAGRLWCTVWGDLLAHTAQRRGVAGTVIDGCCRDATAILASGYPVFSKSVYMKSGKNRVRMVAKQQPALVSGQHVVPGDIVCADDSGVVVVPRAQLERVTGLALEIEAMERRVLASVKSGSGLKDARARENYNQWSFIRRANPS